jgi:hypothetical protein
MSASDEPRAEYEVVEIASEQIVGFSEALRPRIEVINAVLAEVARQDAGGHWPPEEKTMMASLVYRIAHDIREAMRLSKEGK